MHLMDVELPAADSGVYAFTSEFYTEHCVVRARLTSPERRLSDHLNSSVSTVDVRPVSALQLSTGIESDLARTYAQLTKERILFVVPVTEPERPDGQSNTAWKQTATYGAWCGVGPYTVSGTIHAGGGRDPRIALRLLDKGFLPFTTATITFPDGTIHSYPTVLVNRRHLDLLALEGAGP